MNPIEKTLREALARNIDHELSNPQVVDDSTVGGIQVPQLRFNLKLPPRILHFGNVA